MKSVHLDGEVGVVASDCVVADHCNAGLVVLIEDRRFTLREAEFGKEIAQPQDVFGAFGGGNELGFGGAEADGGGCLGEPADKAVSQVDRVTVAGALAGFIGEGGVGKGGNVDGANAPWERDRLVRGREQEAEDTDRGAPVGSGWRLGVLACPADNYGNVGARDGDPQQAADQGKVGTV